MDGPRYWGMRLAANYAIGGRTPGETQRFGFGGGTDSHCGGGGVLLQWSKA